MLFSRGMEKLSKIFSIPTSILQNIYSETNDAVEKSGVWWYNEFAIRFPDEIMKNFRFTAEFQILNCRGGLCVKSNMVYRLRNNMVYTFALGSPSNK